MKVPIAVLCASCVLATVAGLAAEAEAPKLPIPSAPAILETLLHRHPRLLATTEDFARLRDRPSGQSPLNPWKQSLKEQAEKIMGEPASKYEIPDGLRLLGTSRRVLHRVYTLGLLYRLDGDRRYAERAWRELEAAAQFPDWNPRHFLDTAEMTHAFAIGYDWFFEAWSKDQQGTLRTAMIEKGLKPAQAAYRGAKEYGWWSKAHHNWNQVCNGGIGMGALALADDAPALAGELLHAACESLQLAMPHFAPDGAWDEGPGYWNYATSYNVVILAGLQSALGADFGLSSIPGFAETGMFPIYVTGPLGRTFNYADGGDGTIRASQMFWLARRFDRPAYAAYQRKVAQPQALDLLWFDAKSPPAGSSMLDKYFRGVDVVTFRSTWEDREAVFVGFKAGDNQANHSHLDLGSFVLDALGTRWLVDLGADNYNLPGYFGKQRWTYYRMRAEGHNTLVVNPDAEPDQDPKAAARIVRFESKPDRAFAIADLTPAYAKQAQNVTRGIALLNRKQVLVQDQVETAQPAEIWWFLHTPARAEVSPDGRSATLKQDGKRLWARLLSPATAEFKVMDARPLASSPQPEGQARNEGLRKLAVRLPGMRHLRLAVWLVPLQENQRPPDEPPTVSDPTAW